MQTDKTLDDLVARLREIVEPSNVEKVAEDAQFRAALADLIFEEEDALAPIEPVLEAVKVAEEDCDDEMPAKKKGKAEGKPGMPFEKKPMPKKMKKVAEMSLDDLFSNKHVQDGFVDMIGKRAFELVHAFERLVQVPV